MSESNPDQATPTATDTRAMLAAMAMQALIQKNPFPEAEAITSQAVLYADALIKELEK